jgi:ADP-ribosylglycohydrolase
VNQFIRSHQVALVCSKKKVTLEDISIKAGVSVTSVSHALSGKGRVAPATRDRILQIVEELSYKPDKEAQRLARRRESIVDVKNHRGGKVKNMRMSSIYEIIDTAEFTNIVQMEIQQRDEEGYDVEACREEFHSRQNWSKNKLYSLYHDVLSCPPRASFQYQEPDTYNEILNSRPPGPRQAAVTFTADSLYDRIYGGWLGRSIGCVLGKPVECGWSKNKVEQYLKLSGSYPLNNFIQRVVPPHPEFEYNPESDGFFLGEIEGVPCDDDTDYSVLSLHILESRGIKFTTSDVATEWLGHLPYFRTYTAERFAYRNLVMNVLPDAAAVTMNPAREFIGARIRSDVYGFITPGKSEMAAWLAYKDAALTHTKNGIYSAMFMAAMIAWSFVTNDMEEIIEVGLSEIPKKSRLAEAVHNVVKIYRETGDWEIAYDRLLIQYGSYHPVHSINNTVITVLALLDSQNNYDRAICTAVSCGLDTDCNGANTGSVAGIINGAQRIDQKWTVPLQDTLYTTISQWRERRISALARRTAKIASNVLTVKS